MQNSFLKKFSFLILFLSMAFLFPVNSQSQTAKSFKKLNLNIQSYPRMDGSTSVYPLNMLIACKLLNVTYQWTTTTVFSTERRLYPVAADTNVPFNVYLIYRKVQATGTHTAYENLILDISDLILEARQPSPDELELAGKYNIKLIYKPIALDAFVFLLNKNNPVQSLTIKEIQDIYSGKITQWDQVGGTTAKINAYQREDNSGSQELLKELVMKDIPMPTTALTKSMILYGMTGPFNKLSQDTNGLGYSVYYYEENMAPNQDIKMCDINGIMPNQQTIKSKKYPLTTEVYAVIRENLDKKSPAYQMYQWLSSKEGKEVIKESGYVPAD